MEPVDTQRYPRVAQYLSRMPRGTASYPHCMAKALICRIPLEQNPLHDVIDGALPPSVLELVRKPILAGTWVEETRVGALLLAIADHYRMNEIIFAQRSYQWSMQLLQNKAYQLITSMASPKLILEVARIRWGAFHKGVELYVESIEQETSLVTLRFPSFLYTPMIVDYVAAAFRVAIENSNAKYARALVVEATERVARIRLEWQHR